MKKLLTLTAAFFFSFAAQVSADSNNVSLERYLDNLYLDHSIGFRAGAPTTTQNKTNDAHAYPGSPLDTPQLPRTSPKVTSNLRH